jgi:hypothetical protein
MHARRGACDGGADSPLKACSKRARKPAPQPLGSSPASACTRAAAAAATRRVAAPAQAQTIPETLPRRCNAAACD